MAFIHYKRLDIQPYYWRTNHGAEVDALLCKGNQILYALEIQSAGNITGESLTGLKSFQDDNPGVPACVLGIGQNRRKINESITVINWDNFLSEELDLIV